MKESSNKREEGSKRERRIARRATVFPSSSLPTRKREGGREGRKEGRMEGGGKRETKMKERREGFGAKHIPLFSVSLRLDHHLHHSCARKCDVHVPDNWLQKLSYYILHSW